MALVSYDSSGDEISDDDTAIAASRTVSQTTENDLANDGGDRVEPEYKMRVPKSAKLPNLIYNMKTSKTKSGKVLLSLPTVDELNSSDDSEEEDLQQLSKGSKKPLNRATTETGGGLLSLLPPTRALIVREGAKPMIPHQLVVKRPPTRPVGARIDNKMTATSDNPKRSTLLDEDSWENTGNNGEDDDGDDDDTEAGEQDTDGNTASSTFFSFYRPAPQDEKAVAGVRQAAAASLLQSTMPVSSSVPGSMVKTELSTETVQPIPHTENKPNVTQPVIRTPALCSIDPAVLQTLDVPKNVQPGNEDENNEEQYCWSDETFIPGPERKRARLNLPGVRSTVPVDELLSSSNQPIREVSQDDLTAGANLELMKSVTADESQYVSHHARPEDAPGKLAHRKHQITWLAFQAQENEMELEKRWAEARRNKATNRAKYGF